jgi:hypothetical protein
VALFLRVWTVGGRHNVGSDLAGHGRLFSQVRERLCREMNGGTVVVPLAAAETRTLQSLQRRIVEGCLRVEVPDDENEITTKVNLPFDLSNIECLSAGTPTI